MGEINLQRHMSEAIRRIMLKAYTGALRNPLEAKTVWRLQQTFLKSEKRRASIKETDGVEVPSPARSLHSATAASSSWVSRVPCLHRSSVNCEKPVLWVESTQVAAHCSNIAKKWKHCWRLAEQFHKKLFRYIPTDLPDSFFQEFQRLFGGERRLECPWFVARNREVNLFKQCFR